MENRSIFSQGLKTGLFAALASIVMVLLAYVTGISMLGWTYQGINYIVLIAVMVWGLLAFRKANGGYMPFSQGFLIVLVAGLVCSLVGYFFNLFYYNVIDPGYIEKVVEYSKEAIEKMGVGLTNELEEQVRANAEKSMRFSVMNLAFGLVGALMVWSILGAILGAIFSKKDPNAVI